MKRSNKVKIGDLSKNQKFATCLTHKLGRVVAELLVDSEAGVLVQFDGESEPRDVHPDVLVVPVNFYTEGRTRITIN